MYTPSRHRWTGRYEAHLWDKGSWNPTQRKKGKQGSHWNLIHRFFWLLFNFFCTYSTDCYSIVNWVASGCALEMIDGMSSLSWWLLLSFLRNPLLQINSTDKSNIFESLSSGAYDEEESAARAYDLAALKYWGASTFTNFPVYSHISFHGNYFIPSELLQKSNIPKIFLQVSDYDKEIEIMASVTKEEYLASLRR